MKEPLKIDIRKITEGKLNMSLKSKKILVTGAGGFIGSHLSEALVKAGAKTRCLVHYNAFNRHGWLDSSPLSGEMEIIAGDITDRECVRDAMNGCEIVFHLAALIAIPYSYKAPYSYVRTNIDGTLNVLSSARELGTERVVHTSTSEVYGTALYVPIDEKHPLQGQSPYSATKIGADKLAESFHLSFNLPVVTVRPFNTFGPRQSARAVIPIIITQCLENKEVKLGNLHPTRDFNYVGNTVDGFLAAADNKNAVGKTFNIGSGREISIGDTVELIAGLCGRKVKIRSEKSRLRPGGSEVERLLASNALARKELGWKPAVSLEKGLELTIEWFKNNKDRYRIGEYVI